MAQTGNDLVDRIRRMGLSPRQQRLQELWKVYCGYRWDDCAYDWDGTRVARGPELTQAQATGVKSYAVDGEADALPIKFRKPSAPVHLSMVIVNRFTNLLFGKAMRPRLVCAGDADTEDWVNAAMEAAHFWVRMGLSRQYGGATGTAPVGFSFKAGRLRFETCNPCWLTPTWTDREEHELETLEKRMPVQKEVEDPKSGKVETKWFWYRRVITAETDTVFDEVLIPEDGKEPAWTYQPENHVEHGFGFVPWEWIQNLPDQEDDDGEHDFAGIDGLEVSIAQLNSQAHKAIICNLDPTAVMKMLAGRDFDRLRKGSSDPIRLELGKDGTETAEYLEASLPALAQVLAFINFDRASALEIAQCVVDHPDGNDETATAVRARMAPMFAKNDIMREQYGSGIIRLATKIVAAARMKTVTGVAEDGTPVVGTIYVPDREEKTKAEDGTETVVLVPRELGPGGVFSCVWPDYTQPGAAEKKAVVDTAAAARGARLIDTKRAVEYVASALGIDDPQDVVELLAAEDAARIAGFESEVTRGMDPIPDEDGEPVADEEPEGVGDADGAPSKAPDGAALETSQDTVLNGAQISSAVDIVARVVLGELPRDSGLAMLELFFNLAPDKALKVMGTAGTKTPTTPNPEPKGGPKPEPPAFGGGRPFGGGAAPPFAKKPASKPDDEAPPDDEGDK